jgi:hypothetical protein
MTPEIIARYFEMKFEIDRPEVILGWLRFSEAVDDNFKKTFDVSLFMQVLPYIRLKESKEGKEPT